MSIKTAKIIFWVGSMISMLILIILTFDSMGQMAVRTKEKNLSEEVVAGKKIFRKYNCNDCHTILGIGGYYAPDLTRVYRRKGAKYIESVIMDPENTLKNSFRKMPKKYAGGYEVTPEEVKKMITFFKWVDGIDTNNWPPQDHKEKTFGGNSFYQNNSAGGTNDLTLLKRKGCIDCHKIRGTGGTYGPALDGVGSRFNLQEIRKIIKEGKGNMPGRDISEENLQTIGNFLIKQKGGQK